MPGRQGIRSQVLWSHGEASGRRRRPSACAPIRRQRPHSRAHWGRERPRSEAHQRRRRRCRRRPQRPGGRGLSGPGRDTSPAARTTGPRRRSGDLGRGVPRGGGAPVALLLPGQSVPPADPRRSRSPAAVGAAPVLVVHARSVDGGPHRTPDRPGVDLRRHRCTSGRGRIRRFLPAHPPGHRSVVAQPDRAVADPQRRPCASARGRRRVPRLGRYRRHPDRCRDQRSRRPRSGARRARAR